MLAKMSSVRIVKRVNSNSCHVRVASTFVSSKRRRLAVPLLALTAVATAVVAKAQTPDSNEAKAVMERAASLPKIGREAMDHRTKTSNVRVVDIRPMLPPALLMEQLPATKAVEDFVAKTRCQISDIIHGRDDRLICVVGPCSIHDPEAGREYGILLKQLIDEYRDELLVVMRVYFEKPRTTIGWKGMINDPDLNGTFNINKGLRESRGLILSLLERGVPTGCEWLDTITPQFIADIVCWGAIGARTTESQVHRQLVSGLSMPVGFKNATSGDATVAANALLSAKHQHVFSSVTQQGLVAIVRSTGNDDCHIIHRGGASGPNFDKKSIEVSAEALRSKGIRPGIMIDCSHGNSGKDYRNQPAVLESVAKQVEEGSEEIIGVMIESNIVEGKQKLDIANLDGLVYGQSITDSCVNIPTTRQMLQRLAEALRKKRENQAAAKA